jgi:hypothetical protein
MIGRWAITVALAVLLIGTADEAEACMPIFGDEPARLYPPGGTVPSNLAHLYWTTSLAPYVYLVGPDGFEPVSVTISDPESSGHLLTLDDGLRENAEYRVNAYTCPHDGTPSYSFRLLTSGPEPKPQTLGTLRLLSVRRTYVPAPTGSGSCWSLVDAVIAEVEVALSEEAAPWRDALYWRTQVDGEYWLPSGGIGLTRPYGGSWVGRGRDVIFARCSQPADEGAEDQGVAAGTHEVTMTGRLLGDVDVSTPPLAIELDCAAGNSPTVFGENGDPVFDVLPWSDLEAEFDSQPELPDLDCDEPTVTPSASGAGGAADSAAEPAVPTPDEPERALRVGGGGCSFPARRPARSLPWVAIGVILLAWRRFGGCRVM